MNLALYSFSKTLKPSAIHQALALKEKLTDNGAPPEHFRVCAHNIWSKGFKHADDANYQFVKEKL